MNAHTMVSNSAQSSFEPPISELGLMIDPEPLVRAGRNSTKWAGLLVSVLILGAVAYQFRRFDVRSLEGLLPSSPLFWIAFVAYYFASPLSEWVIFRRIWGLPVHGFAALLRKLVSNEILLGYLGEVYFYTWARRHTDITTAPFGAVKDVAILSALTGNIFTLLMVIISVPLFGSLHLGEHTKAFVDSIIAVLVLSGAMLLFRNRLFTLPRRELWFVTALHCVRIVVMMLLAAVLWHMVLPAVALSWWLLLGTLRQLISRLPLVPNKDVVFAGAAAFLVGPDVQIAEAIALFSTLILGAHLMVGAFVSLSDLAGESRTAR